MSDRRTNQNPPQDRYATSGVRYPTPNIDDLIIVEDVPLRNFEFEPVEYNIPHPRNPDALLVWQGEVKGNNDSRNQRRIYATTRQAQDAYNASIEFLQESAANPIYIRTYLIHRDQYARATNLQPLKSVVRVRMTAQGSGYTSEPTVSFSGGAGTGAAATVERVGDKIVAIRLTNGGTGYTSAPTITLTGGGGTGATAAATIQEPTALLVKETAQPAEGELASLFMVVRRVYMVFDGPTTVEWQYDQQTGLYTKVAKTIIKKTDVPADPPANPIPAWGTGDANRRTITEYQQIDDAQAVKIETTFPSENELAGATRTMPITVGHTFPNLLTEAKWIAVYLMNGADVVSYDIQMAMKITEGYSGPCDGTLTEYFTYHPDEKVAALELAITKLIPRADLVWAYQYTTGSNGTVRLRTDRIPETLRDANASMDVDVLVVPSGTPTTTAELGGSYPASDPPLTGSTGFTKMPTILKDINYDRWRGDMFRISVIEIENPHYIP